MNPHVQIVPGSFTLEGFYIALRDAVIAAGYEASIVPLLSTRKRGGQPPATMADDAQSIRLATEALVQDNKDVVLVMHSYGGVPGTESVRGLLREDRNRLGKSGGVVRLVYVTAIAPQVGKSLNTTIEPLVLKYKSISYVKVEGDYMSHEPEASARYTFSDLPAEEALTWAKRMSYHSTISFDGTLTYPAYNYVPVSYIACTEDRCVPVELQHSMIKSIENDSGRKVHVTELECGHCPMVSRPTAAAELIAIAVQRTD